MSDEPHTREEVRVLFTCTANRVRSPFAEAAARVRLHRLGAPAEVRSAGLMEEGRAAVAEMVEVGRTYGYDLSTHRSASVIAEDLDQADLVVPMTGWHVVQLVEVLPDARPKVLTLSEWAAATADGKGIGTWSPVEVRAWAATVVGARRVDSLLSGAFDIDDPIGGPRRAYRRAGQQIDDALGACLDVLSAR